MRQPVTYSTIIGTDPVPEYIDNLYSEVVEELPRPSPSQLLYQLNYMEAGWLYLRVEDAIRLAKERINDDIERELQVRIHSEECHYLSSNTLTCHAYLLTVRLPSPQRPGLPGCRCQGCALGAEGTHAYSADHHLGPDAHGLQRGG